MFPLAQAYVNRVLLVSDEAIQNAQAKLWDVLRVVAEPGGAATLAELLSRQYQPKTGERVGVLVCGGKHYRRGFRQQMKNRTVTPPGPVTIQTDSPHRAPSIDAGDEWDRLPHNAAA